MIIGRYAKPRVVLTQDSNTFTIARDRNGQLQVEEQSNLSNKQFCLGMTGSISPNKNVFPAES